MVASRTVYMPKMEEFVSIHGNSLCDGFKKVSIKKVYPGSENAKLPVPTDEMMILIYAKDSFVQWPEKHIHDPNLVIQRYQEDEKAGLGDYLRKEPSPSHSRITYLDVEVNSKFKEKLRTPALKTLANKARVLKSTTTMIHVPIDEHVLHLKQTCLLSHEELVDLCDEKMITASHISLFMRYLKDYTEKNDCSSSYGFLCSETLSKYASVQDEDVRSNYIVNAITCTVCGQNRELVFEAYHEGLHWMLAVISPSENKVYWCDPSEASEPCPFLEETLTMTFVKRNSMDPLVGLKAKTLSWKKIKCPQQPEDSVLCDYYVCRYMLELIKSRYMKLIPDFMIRAPKTYSVEQIDEVRDIWANFALKFQNQ